MNKLKIFLITSLMVLCSFVSCFATSYNDRNYLDTDEIKSHKYHIRIYQSNASSSVWDLVSNSRFYLEGSQIYCEGDYKLYKTSSLQTTFIYESGAGACMEGGISTYKFILQTNVPSLKNNTVIYIDNVNDSTVSPPEVAPTITEAIAKIVPGLLEQLKKLLPIGVMLFAILLGVRLVPRLIHLFL